VRDVLDLTVSVDHNVVDGAPAARFVADLRSAIESPEDLFHGGGEIRLEIPQKALPGAGPYGHHGIR
jgi:hypothetical protein